MWELQFLVNGEDGYWIYVSDAVADANPDLKRVLTAPELGGLTPLPAAARGWRKALTDPKPSLRVR
jgi:hypothetical protein